MVRKVKEILISVSFMVILLLPFSDSYFHFIPEKENKENRELKSKPVFNINELDYFPQEFDEYYSDNFDLRNQLLSFNSKIKFNIGVPPVKGKAFFGKNDWMYIVEHQMDMYLGKTMVNASKLKEYYNIINYRKKVLDSIGCKYFVVVVPAKTSIYPEFLPLSKRSHNQKTLTDQFVSLLDTMNGVNIIDLRKTLLQAKGGIRLFYKTDNHWNNYGAYVAYKEIIKTINREYPGMISNEILNVKIDSVRIKGKALTNMMGIYDGVYENDITCTPVNGYKHKKGKKAKYTPPPKFPYPWSYEKVFVMEDDNLPKLLMTRDSFGEMIIPYLSEHFSKSVYIFDAWRHNLNRDIVMKEKPDIYVQFVLEMFIPNIYNNSTEPKK